MSAHSFNKLKRHIGHAIEIVGYAKGKTLGLHPTDETRDWENISIECLDCNEVLLDYDKPVKKKGTK